VDGEDAPERGAEEETENRRGAEEKIESKKH
jgi:hypothetical protein